MKTLLLIGALLTAAACAGRSTPSQPPLPPPEGFDPAFHALFAPTAGFGTYGFSPLSPLGFSVRDVDTAGTPMDPSQVAAARAVLHDLFVTLLGVEPGPTGAMIHWSPDRPADRRCGEVNAFDKRAVLIYYTQPGCSCPGSALLAPVVLTHEFGHALGFFHTDQLTDLMHPGQDLSVVCDMAPSVREILHARFAYGRPSP